ncbi:ARM repeat-containing protein [Lactarius vividus]|nr:ARM repeat-containing protein [Lactarius vividus]
MYPPMGHITPLEESAYKWAAASTCSGASGLDGGSPEVVEPKVEALLNRLTMVCFDSISDQIVAWANKSEKEKDGRTLIQVIMLVFERAADEEMFSEMYAHLCRKMMEKIGPKTQDYSTKISEGKPFAGGNLFRKYLLNCCQEDFERGWAAVDVAETKATWVQATKKANEKTKGGEKFGPYSDECQAVVKAKRRGCGLIRFFGELFKLQMLTEGIIHECIKKLLGNVENLEEKGIKSLCKLLTLAGSLLDTPKARVHLNLTKNKNFNARMVYELRDVIELRERKWIPRNAVATIGQVQEALAREGLSREKVAFMQQYASMSRGGLRHDGDRAVADSPHSCAQPRANGQSQFRKMNKVAPMSFALVSVFNSRRGDPQNRGSLMSRTSSSSNMFSMLQGSEARKPSAGLGVRGPPEPIWRQRKLQLLPRTKPVGEVSQVSTPAMSEAGEGGTPVPAAIPEGEAKAKIDEDIKEFFSTRMLDEAESYFSSFPTEHRHRLVDALVMKSIEMTDLDVELVGDLFVRVREKDLCSPAVFEKGFNGLAEILDGLEVDILKDSTISRIAEKTMDPDRLNQLTSCL